MEYCKKLWKQTKDLNHRKNKSILYININKIFGVFYKLKYALEGEQMKKTLVSIKKVISQFDIADRFLILFMLILYLYMMYNLFAGAVYSDDNNAINIITRTSSASIFGYFISGNFAKKIL